jgi:hypothetical protein
MDAAAGSGLTIRGDHVEDGPGLPPGTIVTELSRYLRAPSDVDIPACTLAVDHTASSGSVAGECEPRVPAGHDSQH